MPDRYDSETGYHVLDIDWDESILFDMPFAKRIRSGDTISSVVSVTADKRNLVPGSLDPTIGAPAFSGTTAQARISNLTSGEEYILKFKSQMASGDIVVCHGILQVR